jgi:hypothetical protein
LINADELSKLIDKRRAAPGGGDRQKGPDIRTQMFKRDTYNLHPRDYVLSVVDAGWLPMGTASDLLSSYFYLVQGVYVLDLVWQSRAQFTPHWGLYEVGILSPMLRVFFPQNDLILSMVTQLKVATIHGYFPSAWAAAYIDFGAFGAVIYILIWGFAGGWSRAGARQSMLATPSLLLTFVLASILLSPIQGPLGIANSAQVLVSMLIVGLAVDFGSLKAGSARQLGALKPGTPA